MNVDDVAPYFKVKVSDQLKTMQLVYYAQPFYLQVYGEKLFEEEIQAWERGSVPPKAYSAFTNLAHDPSASMCRHFREHLDSVIEEFANYTGEDLVIKTHEEAPGKDAHVAEEKQVISVESIIEFFKTFDSKTVEKRREQIKRDQDLLENEKACENQPELLSFLE